MPKSKISKTEPPPRWMTAEIEGTANAEQDAETIRRHLRVAKLHKNHPVRSMWASSKPKDRVRLHHLADDLRLVNVTPGFSGLLKRLRTDLLAYDDMRYELRLAGILKRGGQALVSLGGSQAGPDVEFVSQSGHRCAAACYRLRSATDTIQLLRKASRRLADELFRLFHFHPMAGDWLLDVTFPDVPLLPEHPRLAEDLLHEAWKTAGSGKHERHGICVEKVPLPTLRPLPGQRRRCQIRFFYPVRKAELKRASGQVWDKVEKERGWASANDGVPILAIEESDSLLGGALKDDLAATLAVENNPFAGVLLTSVQTIEDAEWLPSPSEPEGLHVHLATFGPNIRSWAHGHHLVKYAPDHGVEEWSFFETVAGAGSELVRPFTYGVHCQRIQSPSEGVEPQADPEFQARVQAALDRFNREMSTLAESNGVVGFIGDS